ncbi:MAG: crossover junction endodeoxyribonuclease RuvC [Kiritimatiellae bacterium]|nr:crossover junction endodeoxyribonuclease RuvC [Kiritimatiellia bacterium]
MNPGPGTMMLSSPPCGGTGQGGRRVLGIDPSLRSTGVGVVESVGNTLRAVEFGRLSAARDEPVSTCLQRIQDGIAEVIVRTAPVAAAIEGVFYCKNARTALLLGEARGVAIVACASRGLPVYEYAPRRVKQAIVGFGAADKEQVRRMVARLLALTREPQEDEGDALALAICHLHDRTTNLLSGPTRI